MSHFLPPSQLLFGLPELCWDHASPLACLQDASPWAAEGPLGHGTTQRHCQTPALVFATSPAARGLPAGISVDGHSSACPGWAWAWAWQGLSSSVPGKCEAPAPERAHAGVWVCHSPVSKLISGSLTRGIKSRSHNGIHSSSCPGREQAPHCPPGLGLGQAKVAGAQLPAGGPCLHPPSSLPRDRTGTGAMFL